MTFSQSHTWQYYCGRASSYRRRGLGAPWEHLALQLEHTQVDVGGGCGRVDVPHYLQSLQDVLVLPLPVASNQSVRVAVGRQDAYRNRKYCLFGNFTLPSSLSLKCYIWFFTCFLVGVSIQETDLSLCNVQIETRMSVSYPTKPSTHGSYTWRGGGTSGWRCSAFLGLLQGEDIGNRIRSDIHPSIHQNSTTNCWEITEMTTFQTILSLNQFHHACRPCLNRHISCMIITEIWNLPKGLSLSRISSDFFSSTPLKPTFS